MEARQHSQRSRYSGEHSPSEGQRAESNHQTSTDMSKLERDFWEFHQKNPHVYQLLVELAFQWKRRRPRSQLGIAALFERLRWEMAIQTESDDGYRLRNDLRSFYARWIMHQEPELIGLFELRKQTIPFTYGIKPFTGEFNFSEN